MRLDPGHSAKLCPVGKILLGRNIIRIAALTSLSLGFLLGVPQQSAPEPAAPAVNAAKSKDPLNRDSPQTAVFAFLEAYHAHDYTRAAKYLDLRKLPRTDRLKQGAALAQQLGQVLDRDAQFEGAELSRDPEGGHADSLPPNRERVDSFTVNGHTLDLELERVPLRSKLSIWLFSQDSVERIPQLARVTSDSPGRAASA